jgi:hypothetical protein
VKNEAVAPALSLHVYSPPLTTMNYYDRSGDRLKPRDRGWVSLRDEGSFPNGFVVGLVAP